MTRNGKIFAGLAAAGVLLAGSAAAIANRHGGWHHRGHHGMGGAMMGLPFGGRVCSGNLAEKVDYMAVRIEHRVKPTDAQKPAFEELKTAMKAAAGKVAAACPAQPAAMADGQGPAGKPAAKELPARLAETETQLAAALDAVRTVRPVAEKFYASLDEAQKKAVSEMGRGGGRKWGHHHRWNRDDRGPGRGDDRGRGPGAGPGTGPGSNDTRPDEQMQ